jgi:ubiquinol-cytochrome c reductase cytochrome b/c1 subunit
VPEWYFLPFYAILRSVPDKLFGVLAMFSAIAILFVLPWLDTSRVRSGNYRPIFKGFFVVFCLVCVALGYLGSRPAVEPYIFWSRICSIYYFAHFLIILPLLGLLESPLPLPASISDNVLAKSSSKLVAAE